MSSADFAPDSSVSVAFLDSLSLVNVGNPLAQIVPDIILAVDVLDLQQSLVDVLP